MDWLIKHPQQDGLIISKRNAFCFARYMIEHTVHQQIDYVNDSVRWLKVINGTLFNQEDKEANLRSGVPLSGGAHRSGQLFSSLR
jgi:hypothetical protein